LVQQLDALLARHGFRNVMIRPLASVAARRLPKKMAGWWVLAEPGWLSLFGVADGAWQHVAGHPVDAGWVADLPELIEREAGLASLPASSTVWVQALGADAVLAAGHANWRILPHDNTVHGALALAGA
jgi:hypothetical protein